MKNYIVQLKRVNQTAYYISDYPVSKEAFDVLNAKAVKRFDYNLNQDIVSFTAIVPHQYFTNTEIFLALNQLNK